MLKGILLSGVGKTTIVSATGVGQENFIESDATTSAVAAVVMSFVILLDVG